MDFPGLGIECVTLLPLENAAVEVDLPGRERHPVADLVDADIAHRFAELDVVAEIADHRKYFISAGMGDMCLDIDFLHGVTPKIKGVRQRW